MALCDLGVSSRFVGYAGLFIVSSGSPQSLSPPTAPFSGALHPHLCLQLHGLDSLAQETGSFIPSRLSANAASSVGPTSNCHLTQSQRHMLLGSHNHQ